MYLYKKRRGSRDEEEVAYWRKANQIHRWFVEHVQGGTDDCKAYLLSREQLRQLLDTVTTVLKASRLVPGKITNGYTYTKIGKRFVEKPSLIDGKVLANSDVARALLPTQGGFFFGNLDYNEFYYDDVRYTRKALTKALASEDDGRFYYRSSW